MEKHSLGSKCIHCKGGACCSIIVLEQHAATLPFVNQLCYCA